MRNIFTVVYVLILIIGSRSLAQIKQAEEALKEAGISKSGTYCSIIKAEKSWGLRSYYMVEEHRQILKKFNKIIQGQRYERLKEYGDYWYPAGNLDTQEQLDAVTKKVWQEPNAAIYFDKNGALNERLLYYEYRRRYHELMISALQEVGLNKEQIKIHHEDDNASDPHFMDIQYITIELNTKSPTAIINYDERETKTFTLTLQHFFSETWKCSFEVIRGERQQCHRTEDEKLQIAMTALPITIQSNDTVSVRLYPFPFSLPLERVERESHKDLPEGCY